MKLKTTIGLLFSFALCLSIGFSFNPAQQSDFAVQILEAMSPEQRVGQLFLVTFTGASLKEDDPILDLITRRFISGVLITSKEDNIREGDKALPDLQALIQTLQEVNYESNLGTPAGSPNRPYLPLFIGYKYQGGQQGASAQIQGLSPLSSNMALGATWNLELARESGELVGKELEALGINLLLGPSLDVLEDPQITGSGDLGIRTFGGDPFWVSEMGKAFINGIQSTSAGRMAIVPAHFPGLGGSDRPVEDEVSTIRKSLEDLKTFDLAPFFAVTGLGLEESSPLVQGLLISHIRYQGFQGNIRATTRPFSLDPQAFSLVMSLDPLYGWRTQGGITLSDSLGSRAIRLFRDPSGQTFNAHLVARDAFLAGNDLLLLDDFRDSGDLDAFTTIAATLDFFRNKYIEDPLFAERVDESALRIIQLKLDLYDNLLAFSNVQKSVNSFTEIGMNQQLAGRIAQEGASLISPAQDEIEARVGGPPQIGEKIVFLTDVRFRKRCSTCANEAIMQAEALQSAVLRLFGPGAAGQVGGWNLRSYTFADLANYLELRPLTPPLVPVAPQEEVDEAIRQADWLVFSMLDGRASLFGADALSVFLDQRPDLARDKKVVVFGHDVPYGLDATELSKIDIFYALYDSGPAFIDMAAKLLFLELSAPGASPVDIPGQGYELIEVTSPDASQVILVRLKASDGDVDPEAGFMLGDTVAIQTGVIVDSNGHTVPDRTPVDFYVSTMLEGGTLEIISSSTVGGIASATVTLDEVGLINITAQAGRAVVSETLQLNAQLDLPAQATVISPTLFPTDTVEPTITPDLASATPGQVGEPLGAIEGSFSSRLGALVMGLLATAITSGIGYVAASRSKPHRDQTLRYALMPAVSSLIAYNYLALGMPGSVVFTAGFGGFGVFAIVLVGGGLGLGVAHIWGKLFTT